MEPARVVRIEINQDQARLLGLSSDSVGSAINSAVTGTTVTQVRDDIYLVNVVVRADRRGARVAHHAAQPADPAVASGRTVPLSQLATLSFDQETPLIWRRDRVPTLTVQADVAPGVLPESVAAKLGPGIDKLNASLPPGYADRRRAAPWRKAPSRRPRCSPWCRSWCC